ncbi:enoyl-CoA hydratase [Spelaeicoccus albus]|uniref:Enoyl-CoA hydratase/carnithine racemase n=1 Tax=Spelaeicoccus albus TaxID=1280376 RepID=A0A7Z0D1X4_9MICO|nr:enoyl-CoA hydratase [Spelaeicoccus albus]NYI67152.1 enoyl-CoA hydratase/carnithine racemase [Spelaeicoccus albus]
MSHDEATDDLITSVDGGVLQVTFNRPKQRNAMTWQMYQGLYDACERADQDESIRVMVLRGAGGDAFVAGTDIGQFREFTGEDGVEYEGRISRILGRLFAVNIPVVAVIDGFCIGGGLGIAAAADIRICRESARFGVPIARTLGNCLSTSTLGALVRLIGQSLTTDLLLTARLMDAAEALRSGFVTAVADDLDAEAERLTGRLLGNAPLTMWATKESLRRLNAADSVDDDDIVSRIYGSNDFAGAVDAFLSKAKPEWHGR